MVSFALSFQGEVEKYGVYVGIAAFFGLAILSVLYFAQAREIKRLREWAGRAPERARELEERVAAQAAAASAARPAPAMPARPVPGSMAPPRRLAEMPATAATDVAEAEESEADPATNGVPRLGPGGTIPAGPPAAQNGASPPAAEPEPEPEGAEPQPAQTAEPEPAAAALAANGSASRVAPGDTVEADVLADEDTDEEAAQPAPPLPSPAPAPVIPRATPAQRVGVTPRPAALPLREAPPSAAPPRRPAPAPGQGGARRPAPATVPDGGRSAGTVALLVGLAVLVLGGGAFGLSQLLGDDPPAQPNRAAQPATQTEIPTGGGSAAGDDGAPSNTPAAETTVAVLNGTTFTGLAGQIADRVSREGGFDRGATGNNTPDQSLQSSTVHYASGFRSQARAVARLLSIRAVEPLDAETRALAQDADVVVLAGADQAP